MSDQIKIWRVKLQPRRRTLWERLFPLSRSKKVEEAINPPDKLGEVQAEPLDVEVLDQHDRFVYLEEFDISRDEAYRIYDAIWRNMDRENNLINQRITWSILLTAGVLAAEGLLLRGTLELLQQHRADAYSHHFMLASLAACAILSLLASIFSMLSKLGVDAAQRQLTYLKRRYFRLKDGDKPLFQGTMRLPRPFGNNEDHISGNVVAQFFPTVIAIIWLIFFAAETWGALSLPDVSKSIVQSPSAAVPTLKGLGNVQERIPADGNSAHKRVPANHQ